jgi:hypothetical protein
MRWRSILIGVLSLLGTTVCPHSWGRGGTIDIRQKYCMDPDNMEQCPEECE